MNARAFESRGLDVAVAPAPREPRVLVVLRAVLQRLFVLPAVRLFCRPLMVRGEVARTGGIVFVANHASHADALTVLAALPAEVRARTKPAAAEDYFFASRARGFATRLVIGAFPFPRRGRTGLARAEAILAAGGNVVLFPEGTRSTTGRIAPFKPGAGVLAARGWTVVPIALAGTCDVIAKGGRLPRRASVVVSFGEPVRMPGADARAAAALLERRVRAAVARASLARP